jgi:pyridoxal phosphate enzyme (YggS family)
MPPDGLRLPTLLRQNRDDVRARLAAAAAEARRRPEDVRLIAVTKTVSPEVALELAALGQEDLAENRLAGLEAKAEAFAARGVQARWHFVGHLQRNKARKVARLAHAIHAVDTRALLELLLGLRAEEGLAPGLYLQVKLADEDAKSGLAPAEVPGLVALARERGARLLGLMAMAPLAEGPAARAEARRVFEALAALARELPGDAFAEGRPRLSMGMSGDLEEAVRAGATDVRVGTAFFRGIEEAA